MALKKQHFVLIVLVFLADQISKYFALWLLKPMGITSFLRLSTVHNTGVAFGLLQFQFLRWFLAAFAMAVIILLFFYSRKQKDSIVLYSIALIISGALGNLVDRIFFGYVIDFIDFGFWPAFNIADSAITIGILALLYKSIRGNV